MVDPVDRFPAGGSQLERCSHRFNGVEINSSFYRHHRHSTYARWADTVPDDFRFAVKFPREAAHEHQLEGCADVIRRFSTEVNGLGRKLSVLLVQLPPSLAFATSHGAFFQRPRDGFDAAIVCEPRHASWFVSDVNEWLSNHRIGRVAADPALCAKAGQIGGWTDGLEPPTIACTDRRGDTIRRMAARRSRTGRNGLCPAPRGWMRPGSSSTTRHTAPRRPTCCPSNKLSGRVPGGGVGRDGSETARPRAHP